MQETMNEMLEVIKQTNVELKENSIRLQQLAEKMGIVIDEQQIMKMGMKEINQRLDVLLERFEDREQRHLKVVH
ncbi:MULTISPECIES: hypothetical protein [Brevibacillus]|uniref:hypothetical protein n=1 Tax=Brevibacillus TaxID=55080 RepID=UPI000EB8D52A|nr:hypothetical protein [Brevibacillus sp.]HBZ79036.1 hypothetical protein [Brevibacillus sp.]